MSKAKKIAMAGIFSALCVIFLFVGSVLQTLDLSAAAIASIIVLVAFIELGRSWAWGVYAVVSILSLLILPYKTAAVVFAMFAGFYPIIKEFLNKIRPLWLSITARMALLNLFLTFMIFVSKRFFNISEDFLAFDIILYALSNITFFIFDLALERLSVYYVSKIRPKLFK